MVKKHHFHFVMPIEDWKALKKRAEENGFDVTRQALNDLRFAAAFKLEYTVYRQGDALVEISKAKS